MDSDLAKKSLKSVSSSEAVDVIIVVDGQPPPEQLRAAPVGKARMRIYRDYNLSVMQSVAAAVRSHREVSLISDSSEEGRLLVRGPVAAFVDDQHGLFAVLRDEPVRVYPNERLFHSY